MTLKNDWVDGDAFTPAAANAVATQINTNVTDISGKQASDSDLTAIAGLTPSNDDVLQRKSGAWTNRTLAQLKTDLTIASDIVATQLVAINAQSGTSYTLVLSDASKAVECSNGATVTVTVPPNSSVAFPTGTVIDLLQVGAGQLVLAPGAGVTINTPTTLTAKHQWSMVRLRKRSTDSWLISGDLT